MVISNLIIRSKRPQMNSLKKNLALLLEKKNITIAELERKTGLSRSAVTNILTGGSKNPSASSLKSIAKALEVTVESIMSDDLSKFEGMDKPQLEAFLQSAANTIKLLLDKEYQLTIDQLIEVIKEIYSYSISSTPPAVDDKFVNWVLEKRSKN